NFGMAVVEAMAAGLPVVISDQVGIAPDIAATNSGVVTSLNPDEIAERLEQLIISPQERVTLGRRAAQFARKTYAPEVVARDILSEIEKLSASAIDAKSIS